MESSAVPFTRPDLNRFLLLSRSRSGSAFLISCLNSHPNIRARQEVCNRIKGRDPQTVLDEVYGRHPRHIKAAGFKIFYNHPVDDRTGVVWRMLAAMKDLKVIHLRRKNLFRVLVSHKIARRHNTWKIHSSDGLIPSSERIVSFEPMEVERRFLKTLSLIESRVKLFSNHAVLTVHYEDLEAGLFQTFGKITDFLGVDYAPPKPLTLRQNPEPLRELVSNYADLKSAFSGTLWESFFDE